MFFLSEMEGSQIVWPWEPMTSMLERGTLWVVEAKAWLRGTLTCESSSRGVVLWRIVFMTCLEGEGHGKFADWGERGGAVSGLEGRLYGGEVGG